MFDWLFRKTVNDWLSGFDKIITGLEKAVDYHNWEETVHTAAVAEYTDLAARARSEAARASAVAKKIRALLDA